MRSSAGTSAPSRPSDANTLTSGDAPALTLEEAVLKSIAETGGQGEEPRVVLKWHQSQWWIGTHPVTTEELASIAALQTKHNRPHHVTLRVLEDLDDQDIIAVVDILKASGVARVEIAKPQNP